jgi:uridine kinase
LSIATDRSRRDHRRVKLPLADAAELIRGRVDVVGGPVLVALDGFSAAGKSTAAAGLAAVLGAAVVHVDDFYRDMPDAARLGLSPADGVEEYFDWQRLREQALIPLRRGLPARYCRFDWATGHGLAGEVHVPPRPIVLIEGVYSARPQLSDCIDIAIYVDTPPRRRRQRIQDRGHGNQPWNARWDAAESLYFQTIRPLSTFDVTIPGSS